MEYSDNIPEPWTAYKRIDDTELIDWHVAVQQTGHPFPDVCVMTHTDPEVQAQRAHFAAAAPELAGILLRLVLDWERVHGPIASDHEAKAILQRLRVIPYRPDMPQPHISYL